MKLIDVKIESTEIKSKTRKLKTGWVIGFKSPPEYVVRWARKMGMKSFEERLQERAARYIHSVKEMMTKHE